MNEIKLVGTVTKDPEYAYTFNGKQFGKFYVGVARLSDVVDELPCIAPKTQLNNLYAGDRVILHGEIRTGNYRGDDGKRHLRIYVYVEEMEDGQYFESDLNSVRLVGFTCKPSTLRKTPNGIYITDSLVASHRSVGRKSDYIPCISFGDNAFDMQNIEVGRQLKITGRLQSRIYTKKLDNEVKEERIAYELAVSRFKLLDERED